MNRKINFIFSVSLGMCWFENTDRVKIPKLILILLLFYQFVLFYNVQSVFINQVC